MNTLRKGLSLAALVDSSGEGLLKLSGIHVLILSLLLGLCGYLKVFQLCEVEKTLNTLNPPLSRHPRYGHVPLPGSIKAVGEPVSYKIAKAAIAYMSC